MKPFSRHRTEVNENVVFVFKLAHLYLLKLCNKPVCGFYQFGSNFGRVMTSFLLKTF